MIWLRRSLAVLLGLVLVFLFLLSMVGLRINSTFSNPAFYNIATFESILDTL